MIEIKQKLTPYNFTRMYNKQNEYIVIHFVGGVSTAKNNADYFANNKLQSSANYFADETEIWQSVEDGDKAWHCGGGLQGENGHAFYGICTNSNSIGVEMCVKKDNAGKWYFEEKTVQNTVELVKMLMKKHNIPIGKVIRHYDVTGKICPAPYIDETEWKRFKDRIVGDNKMEDCKFEDIKGHYAEKQIKDLYRMGIINGVDAAHFAPDEPIKRADVAIIARNVIRYITGK